MTYNLKSQFAVLYKTKKPLEIKNLIIPKLKSRQLLIKIKYTFVCGTQLKEIFGLKGKDKYIPHTLGHEATGIVKAKGDKVKNIKIGDKVILSWIKNKKVKSSENPYYLDSKKKINSGLVSTFSNLSIISSDRVYKIHENKIPLSIAALLGCAAATGFGIILKYFKKFNKNDFVGIYGMGGVGLMSLIYLRHKGVKNIYVIDKNKNNLKIARKFGCLYASNFEKFNKTIIGKKIQKDQIKYNFEMSGNKFIMNKAIENLSAQGTVVFAGNLNNNETIKINPYDLIFGKKIFGFSANEVDLKKNINFYLNILKKVKYKKLIKIFKTYNLQNINKAIYDFKEGKIIRPLIKF